MFLLSQNVEKEIKLVTTVKKYVFSHVFFIISKNYGKSFGVWFQICNSKREIQLNLNVLLCLSFEDTIVIDEFSAQPQA